MPALSNTVATSCIWLLNTCISSFRSISICYIYFVVLLLSHVCFFSLWTVAPLFTGFLRQESWSESPFPSPGDFSDLETVSPALAGGVFLFVLFFTSEPPGKLDM